MRIAALVLLLLLTGATSPDGERRYVLTSFDRIRIDGPFEVEVAQGTAGASVTGAPASFDRLSLRVEGSTLIVNSGAVGMERRMRDVPEATRIRIAAPLLRAISGNGGARVRVTEMRAARVDIALRGTGSLDVAGIRADELYVANIGMGAMTLRGAAKAVRIQGGLAGTVDAAGFIADDANLLWQSQNALTIGVRYTAQITASGQGAVTIIGKPFCKIRGSAPVTCDGTVER